MLEKIGISVPLAMSETNSCFLRRVKIPVMCIIYFVFKELLHYISVMEQKYLVVGATVIIFIKMCMKVRIAIVWKIFCTTYSFSPLSVHFYKERIFTWIWNDMFRFLVKRLSQFSSNYQPLFLTFLLLHFSKNEQ